MRGANNITYRLNMIKEMDFTGIKPLFGAVTATIIAWMASPTMTDSLQLLTLWLTAIASFGFSVKIMIEVLRSLGKLRKENAERRKDE